MHNKVKQLASSNNEATLSPNCAANEASSEGGDIMTTTKLWMKGGFNLSESAFKALAIVKFNMTEEAFMQHWGKMYPEHCFGGYNEDQWALWQASPFEFVAKWTDFCHYLIREYN